eukprot:3903735-Prymnesium_polylepis.1
MGTHLFSGHCDKGYFEIVGTLNSDATISAMQTIYMGENFGARACPCASHSPRPAWTPHHLPRVDAVAGPASRR